MTSSHMATPLFALYAENARDASGADLTVACAICGYGSRPGERIADLAGGRGTAHCSCIAEQVQRIGGRH